MSLRVGSMIKKIHINQKLCADCGWCLSYCKFGVIFQKNDDKIGINQQYCHGCEECIESCPRHAISVFYDVI
jgi:MinD superfamily P-loop ATPase